MIEGRSFHLEEECVVDWERRLHNFQVWSAGAGRIYEYLPVVKAFHLLYKPK